jgi:endonuclease/exonuclease/phosphatase family metal-dependent hydrolase
VVGGEEVELALDEVGESATHRPRVILAVAVIVRTWNLFHGRTVPVSRQLELERMVRLVSEDRPALVGLQEVPIWTLEHLEEWSGMRAVWAVAMPAFGGPLARRMTALDPRRFRSALVGQANALLLGETVERAGAQRVIRLNPLSLQRTTRTDLRGRLNWLRNRRVCQTVPVRIAATRAHVVNLHASKEPTVARVELDRLARLLPDGPVVVLGDFNTRGTGLPGFSPPSDGIDQILVRGLELEAAPTPWPPQRRRRHGALLSDHAPVEAALSLGSRG